MWLHPCTNELLPVFSEEHMHISIRKPSYSQLTTVGYTYVDPHTCSSVSMYVEINNAFF